MKTHHTDGAATAAPSFFEGDGQIKPIGTTLPPTGEEGNSSMLRQNDRYVFMILSMIAHSYFY